MTRGEIARVCYEVNRAYCQALGDNSQPPWEEAENWMRASVMNGVDLHMINPEAGPEACHKSWLAEKEATGWRFGHIKMLERKSTHAWFCSLIFRLNSRLKILFFLFCCPLTGLSLILMGGEYGSVLCWMYVDIVTLS